MGIIIPPFNDAGIEPMLKQDFQKIVSVVDRTYCFRKIAGNPSGPEAGDIMSVSEKCRFCNLAHVFNFIG